MVAFLFSLLVIFNMVVIMLFYAQLMPSRINVWQMILVSTIISIPALIRLHVEWESNLNTVLTWANIVFGFSCCFFYIGKLWKRILLMCYFFAIVPLSEILIATLIMTFYKQDILSSTANRISMTNLAIAALTQILIIILGALTVFVWRVIMTRKFQPFYLLFFVFPVGQFLMLYSFEFSVITTTTTLPLMSGIIITMFADMMLLVYTLSNEKKTELEEELRETHHAMELEQSHYRGVENRREELLKIRHDINNQLASISRLIRTGEETSAQDLIKTLSDEIAGTIENPYCDIPVVNAILTEKAQVCASAGITLKVDLKFPADLIVEQMHLCSIFGNMLDNAINACKPADSAETPVIELKTAAEGGYLFIKVVNPSGEPPKKPEPGRGYGSRILADFAERYGGVYSTEYADGIFTAMVSLLAAKEM